MNIIVLGTSGVGKTTVAKQVAAYFGLKQVSLDQLHWLPNWERAGREVLRNKVDEITRDNGWVIDGNYSSVRDILWPRANIAIWLDFSFGTAIFGAFKRISAGTYQAPGCKDTFSRAFTKESIFLWILKSHWRHKKEYNLIFKNHTFPNLKVIRLKKRQDIAGLIAIIEQMNLK